MKLRRIANLAGTGLAILGLCFVTAQLWRFGSEIDLSIYPIWFWGLCAGLSVLYGLANHLLALAYKLLLSAQGTLVSTPFALRLYGISQLAKYVPGNVAHLAGRNLLGASDDVGHRHLAKATLFEILLLIASALTFVPIGLSATLAWISPGAAILASLTLALMLVTLLGLLFSRNLALACLLHLVFFLISGLCFLAIVLGLGVEIEYSPALSLIVGAFVIAWLAGFVTPGAPAGIGSREAVLFYALAGVVSQSDLLIAILLSRFVSVCGDIMTYTMVSAMPTAQGRS